MQVLKFICLLYLFASMTNADVINVHNDGRADYYDVVQSALNNITKTGGTVILRNGVFVVSKNLEMFSNTHLRGVSMEATTIKLQNNAAPWWNDKGKDAGLIRATFVNNTKISDITLDGNKKNQKTDEVSAYGRFGIFMDACNNVTYDKVKVINFQGYGFDPHGFKPNKWAKGLVITNCVSNDNDWDGFTLDQTDDIYAVNNTALRNGRHGFNVVTGSRNVVLENNYALENGFEYYSKESNQQGVGCGIAIQNNLEYGTKNITIKNNTIITSKKASICLNDVIRVTIDGNLALNSTFLVNDNSKDVIITNNQYMSNNTNEFVDSTKNNTLVFYDTFPDPPVESEPTPITEDSQGDVPSPQSPPSQSPSSPSPTPLSPPSFESKSTKMSVSFVALFITSLLGTFMF